MGCKSDAMKRFQDVKTSSTHTERSYSWSKIGTILHGEKVNVQIRPVTGYDARRSASRLFGYRSRFRSWPLGECLH